MTLKELLLARAIDRVLIVDDGYDLLPKAADLSNDRGAWAIFIDDLAMHHEVVEQAYPSYAQRTSDELIRDDGFVEALWHARAGLDPATSEALFGQYERDGDNDRTFLAALETRLVALGLAVQRAGRGDLIADRQIPLVFVDLFLGGAQDDNAMAESMRKIRDLVDTRRADPPLVVLMSRATTLKDRREHFRSETGLLGAMFRVSAKSALLAENGLEHILARLAQHREDGRKVAAFLEAWNKGLDAARHRFMRQIGRLDLPDYAQIRDLLVNFEGQPLGGYLLDVFDRVLQYEVEADRETIQAAIALNDVDLSKYLAPHIAGSPDLQDFVHRTIHLNPERHAMPTTRQGVPLAFGDIIHEAPQVKGVDLADRPVLAVMTPACDLVRPGCTQVLLLQGVLRRLRPRDWIYGTDIRTPVLILPPVSNDGERRYWISWMVREFSTWTAEEVATRIAPAGSYERIARLRESVALELQQRMLSDMGRVGQIAHLPGTSVVDVELWIVDRDGKWDVAPLPGLARDRGVLFRGRDSGSKPNERLVLSEAACNEIMTAISAIGEDQVPPDAKASLARLQDARDLASRLENGLDVTGLSGNFSKITTERVGSGETTREPIGLLAFNPEKNPKAQARKEGVIAIVLREFRPESDGAGLDAARGGPA